MNIYICNYKWNNDMFSLVIKLFSIVLNCLKRKMYFKMHMKAISMLVINTAH